MGNKITEKINIRNPFFISADAEGAPELPAAPEDPVDDPVVPAVYVEPSQVTQTVQCGEEVNIGEDVGGKIYTLNVGKATGNVTIDYTVNVPISITGYWDTSTPNFSSTGYVGNDIFEQDLLDAGISAGSMNLGSGVQTGTVTINKTAETPETVNVLVSAPLRTDDYQLTFNCPAAPAVTAPAGNVPSTIPSDTGFFEQIPAFYIQMDDNFDNTIFDLQLKVNDTIVVSNFTTTGWYVFTDYDGVQTNFGVHPNVAKYGGASSSTPARSQGYVQGLNGCISEWTTPTTFFAQSDYFNTDLNKIEFIYTLKSNQPRWVQGGGSGSGAMTGSGVGHPFIRYVKTGLFYDTVNSVWRYPMNQQRDASQFDWKTSNNYPLNQQNNDTVFISELFGVYSTSTPYGGDKSFSNYGDPNKYTIQFFWRSSGTAGLDNPYLPTNPYYTQFAGRTYKILLDDGAGGKDAQILSDESGARDSGGVLGCFS